MQRFDAFVASLGIEPNVEQRRGFILYQWIKDGTIYAQKEEWGRKKQIRLFVERNVFFPPEKTLTRNSIQSARERGHKSGVHIVSGGGIETNRRKH
jgi:hypothetical protein